MRKSVGLFLVIITNFFINAYASHKTIDADGGGADYTEINTPLAAVGNNTLTVDTLLLIGSDQDSYAWTVDLENTSRSGITLTIRSSITDPDLFPIITKSSSTKRCWNLFKNNNLTFENLLFSDLQSDDAYGFSNAQAEGKTHTFRNCVIRNQSTDYFYKMEGYAENTDIFENCLLHGNAKIFAFDYWNSPQPTIKMINCTFDNNTELFAFPGNDFSTHCTNVTYKNNIYSTAFPSSASGTALKGKTTYSLTAEATTNYGTGCSYNTTIQYVQSSRTNPTDWEITSGSPAKDFGNSTGAPTTDMLAATRSGNPDAGCFEVIKTDFAWDINTSSGIQPGSGTWGTDNYWTTDGTILQAWPGAGNSATFGGSDGTYAVTVSNTQNVDSIAFTNSGYTLSGGTINFGSKSGILVASGKSDTIGSVISGSGGLSKYGAGRLIISGANIYTGTTTIRLGTLQFDSGNTSGSLSSSSNITNNATLIFNRSDAYSYGGVISGSGSVTNAGAGTTTLSGMNTYTGTTTISGGTLQIGSGGTSGAISNSSNISNSGTLVFNRSDDYTYSGVISGSGAVTKSGAGTLRLSGTNTYTGVTTVSAGTLLVIGSTASGSAATVASGATLGGTGTIGGAVSMSGTISPGTTGTGTLSIGGNLTFSSGSPYSVTANGTIAGSGYDQTVCTGAIVTLGNATLSFAFGYAPAVGHSYTIIDNQGSNAISGTFNGIAEGGSFVVGYAGMSYDCAVSYVGGTGNDVVVTVIPLSSVILTQPTSTTVKPGDTALFKLTATGGTPAMPVAYRWFRDASPITGDPGASPACSVKTVQATDNGANFKCAVYYNPNSDTVWSNPCTLYMIVPPQFSQQPLTQTVRKGSSVSFSIRATGTPPPTYIWIKNISDTVSGATDTVLILSSVQSTDDNSRFRCIAKNSAGSATSNLCTLHVVSAGFAASPTSGAETLTVQFIDKSTGGATSYQWNFGDGSPSDTSNARPNPRHFYATIGKYTVQQIVSATGISDTAMTIECIAVNYSKPIPFFYAGTLFAADSLTVHFTDTSKGTITSRKWDFGDGSTANATTASMAHFYKDTGSYTVKLVVSGPGGTDSLTRQNFIFVYARNDNPIYIHAKKLSQDSVVISFYNFSSLMTSKKKPLPPYADTMGLWFKRDFLPTSSADSLLMKYSLVDMQNIIPEPFVDTLRVPFSPPGDSVFYGFSTALFWVNAPLSTMKRGNGDLLFMRDTVWPINDLVVLGTYLDADSFAICLDNISSLDTAKVDSVGIWYGFRDSASFSDTMHTKWIPVPSLIASASQNRYIQRYHENRLNGDTARIYCAALVIGKNRLRSAANDSSFIAGRLRPNNPIRLFAKAIGPSTIHLNWKEKGTGNSVTEVDSILIWKGMREVPLVFAPPSRDFTPLHAPLTGDTLISSGLNEKTRYFYGAQVYAHGLWSSITDSSSATDSTPAILSTDIPINTVKITKLTFNTSNNEIIVCWHVDTPYTNCEIGIAYSLVTYPADTLHLPNQAVLVKGAIDSAIVDVRGALSSDTTYYVSLWFRKKDGKWALPVSASEASVKIPEFSWQVVTYFIKYPDTVSVFGGKMLLANDAGNTVPTTDTVKYWDPLIAIAGSKGFVPVSKGFYFIQHQPSAPFHIGIKYSANSLPTGYTVNDIRIYRDIGGELFIDKNTIRDTAQRIAWILTRDISSPFIAMIDTIPVTVNVLSNISLPVVSGRQIVDTFEIIDNCANSVYKHIYAKGDNSVESRDSSEARKSVDTIMTTINRSYVNQENGVRTVFIVSDGPHAVSKNVSRQVIRDNTSDIVTIPGGSWYPLQAAAQLDSPGVQRVLKDLNGKGQWCYDNSVFRLFRWFAYTGNATESDKWVEYSDANDWIFNFDPCRLMWIKTRKPVTLHLGRGVTASLKQCYTIVAAPETWSDIAVPYGFSIRIGDIIDSTNAINDRGDKGDSLSYYYWQIDSTKRYRSRPIFLAHFEKAAPFLADKADTLSKNVGGFTVYNMLKTQVTLSIPPIPSSMSQYRVNNLWKKTQQCGWVVCVSGRTASGTVLSEVYCGYSEGQPAMRYYPVPMLFSGIGINVCDSLKRPFGHALAQGIWNRQCGIIYPLAFSNSSDKSETIDYFVENLQQLPKNASAMIIDYSTGTIDNASCPSRITLTKGETAYRHLAIGTDEYLKKVKREMQGFHLALVAIHSNPFAHALTIRYSLPYGGVKRVTFSIIDLMGRIVWDQSVSCDHATGMQEYVWNGRTNGHRPVGAGMYILRMAAFGEQQRSVGAFEKIISYLP